MQPLLAAVWLPLLLARPGAGGWLAERKPLDTLKFQYDEYGMLDWYSMPEGFEPLSEITIQPFTQPAVGGPRPAGGGASAADQKMGALVQQLAQRLFCWLCFQVWDERGAPVQLPQPDVFKPKFEITFGWRYRLELSATETEPET